MVRAKIADPAWKEQLSLFEPNVEIQEEHKFVMEEAVIDPDLDHRVLVMVENNENYPVKLKKGSVLGTVVTVKEVEQVNAEDDVADDMAHCVASIQTAVKGQPMEREKQLLKALHVNRESITKEEVTQLEALVQEYTDVFTIDPSDLCTTDRITHGIETGDQRPIRQPPRRVPFALRDQVNKMVQDMLDRGIIEPSKSPWASPIVLVEKKDGTLRFCVDYRRLNAATKIEVFPLPRIDDSLDMLSKSRYFTTLDLDSGFWQVPMEHRSQEKTAFITHSGLYQFRVMPFGLVNAPSTFQRLMESVLAGLSGETCIVYIDDIIVPGATFQEHLGNLRAVLDRLRSASLKLKPKKCNLTVQQVEYLGYVVSQDGLSTDPKKVDAVQKFPTPTDLKDLRSFLGLASYYRRFIPHFSAIASPLFALTRKDVNFDWSPDCQQAFDRLKRLLTTAPVMTLPDFKREFLLETHASGLGLGAVLAQKQDDGLVRPIAFG